MIARESLEKSLPRLASAAPFLCLIDDHLLCPDTRCLPYDLTEELVDARVVGELGMERRDKDTTFARQYGPAFVLGENLNGWTGALDPWRSDEDGAQRPTLARQLEVGLERAHLTPVGVAANDDVGQAEQRLAGQAVDGIPGEQDHAGAGAEDGAFESADRRLELVGAHQLADRGGLAAGDDQPVEPVELVRFSHLARLNAEPPEHGQVLAEVSLHGKDADTKRPIHTPSLDSGLHRAPGWDYCFRYARCARDRRNPRYRLRGLPPARAPRLRSAARRTGSRQRRRGRTHSLRRRAERNGAEARRHQRKGHRSPSRARASGRTRQQRGHRARSRSPRDERPARPSRARFPRLRGQHARSLPHLTADRADHAATRLASHRQRLQRHGAAGAVDDGAVAVTLHDRHDLLADAVGT